MFICTLIALPFVVAAKLFFTGNVWWIVTGMGAVAAFIGAMKQNRTIGAGVFVVILSMGASMLIGYLVISPILRPLPIVRSISAKTRDLEKGILTRGISEKIKSAAAGEAVISAGKAVISADSANFRAAPSTSSNVLKSLKKGEALNVTGAASDGWLPVEHDGVKGYISADLVSVQK
jgi:hypothetical protein